MTPISRVTGWSWIALTLIAFLGISEFLIARQTAEPAQSKPQAETGSQTKSRQSPSKTKSKAKTKDGRSSKNRAGGDPPGVYMGRQIADVMSWEGVDWLFRETRIDEEQPEAMLEALKIPRGATVADVGAGAGYHSIRLARRVGPQGTVLASDVQPEMLRMLRTNARTARVTNIKPILASQGNTKLPKGTVDLILMVDVYHECTDPERTLQGLFEALKPRGRLVLVEFRGEDPDVPIKPEHKMTVAQVRREVEPQGFVFKEPPLEFLPWQHVIIFEKPAELKSDADPPAPAGAPAAKTKDR
jgi:ubiquinone/menaquinone biosynthesis C-methylase UbiE